MGDADRSAHRSRNLKIADEFEDGGYQNPDTDVDEDFFFTDPAPKGDLDDTDEDFEMLASQAFSKDEDYESGDAVAPQGTDREEIVFNEIEEVVGFNPDLEGHVDYPLALVGDVDIQVDDEVRVSYQLGKDRVSKRRDPAAGYVGPDELSTLLAPTHYSFFEVSEEQGYVTIDFSYPAEDLEQGGKEVGAALETVEEYLSTF
ncbi:MAG: hypothetical protein ABEJ99_02370 [Candidatus Nanohaloarchaea archaeon]